MECCIVVVIVLIVIILAFGSFLLAIAYTILSLVYEFVVELVNWIRRKLWTKSVMNFSYNELQTAISDIEGSLTKLKAIDKKLSSQIISKKGFEIENLMLDSKISSNKTRMEDAVARIKILKGLPNKLQPLEDARLAAKQTQRQKEIEELTLTAEYKLIEQFVNTTPNNKIKENLSKLQLLLESKGWEITQNELQDLIRKYKEKQDFESAKTLILETNPEGQEEILKSYLTYYQPYDVELNVLEEILQERNLSFSDSVTLQTQLEKVKSKQELEQFEQNLLNKGE